MSDRINQLIDSVRDKSMSLKGELASEKQKSEQLESEVQGLKQEMNRKDAQISELNDKITALDESIKAAKEQNIAGSSGSGLSDEHIDELVKEIEYCIGQLKK